MHTSLGHAENAAEGATPSQIMLRSPDKGSGADEEPGHLHATDDGPTSAASGKVAVPMSLPQSMGLEEVASTSPSTFMEDPESQSSKPTLPSFSGIRPLLFSPMGSRTQNVASISDGRNRAIDGEQRRRAGLQERRGSIARDRSELRAHLAASGTAARETRRKSRNARSAAKQAEFEETNDRERNGVVWRQVLSKQAGSLELGNAPASRWASWLRHDTHHPSSPVDEAARRRRAATGSSSPVRRISHSRLRVR